MYLVKLSASLISYPVCKHQYYCNNHLSFFVILYRSLGVVLLHVNVTRQVLALQFQPSLGVFFYSGWIMREGEGRGGDMFALRIDVHESTNSGESITCRNEAIATKWLSWPSLGGCGGGKWVLTKMKTCRGAKWNHVETILLLANRKSERPWGVGDIMKIWYERLHLRLYIFPA